MRSARDTVASVLSTGNGTARGRCDCQPHGGRELGLEDMVKVTESLLSRRESNHAKEADRHEPKGMQSGWGVRVSPHADVALPAERRGLSPSRMVRVRNVVSPTIPTRIVAGGPQGLTGGRVGMGCRSKRMPVCNRPDRGSSFALPRKGADFRLVLDHEKGAERLNHRGYFRRCVLSAPLKARWALCASSVQPRIVKATRCGPPGALRRLLKA